MNKTVLIIFFSVLAISLGIGLYYLYSTNYFPKYYFFRNQKVLDWKGAENVVKLKCKEVVLSNDQESLQYISKLYSKIDGATVEQKQDNISYNSGEKQQLIGMPVVRDNQASKDISNSQQCWVVFVGNKDGNGEISYETGAGLINVLQVKNFPVPSSPQTAPPSAQQP